MADEDVGMVDGGAARDDEEELGQVDARPRGDDDDDDGREGGRGRTRERDDAAPAPAGGAREYENKIVLEISDDDAAFILGKQGRTKEKIARVSGARIELLERSRTLEIMGPPQARSRAKKYVEAVMAQRVGPVSIDEDDGDDDLTVVFVPHEAVGFVTGSQGNFLRSIEEEWGTLMFFAEYRGRRGPSAGNAEEKLAIFGPRRSRRGAHLKVLAAVETKVRNHFAEVITFPDDDEAFGTDTRRLEDNELSYALGKKGGTRKKLAASSECIVEYVGNTVYMCGSPEQRARARQYLSWLFEQLKGPVYVDYKGRDDCTVVEVPRDTVGYVTGARRATLGRIEEEWGTLMFFMETRMQRDGKEARETAREAGGTEKLAIFGPTRGRRGAELKVMSAVETKNPGHFTKEAGKAVCDEEWGTDTYPLTDQELSYALGKDGGTRKKLARASHCVVEYVGHIAHLAGTRAERERARDYLKWLLKQRQGPVRVDGLEERTDVSVVRVPPDCVGYVTGNRGSCLRQVEEDSGTFCFLEGGGRGADEQLLIFGHDKSGRAKAEHIVKGLVDEKLNERRGPPSHGGGYGDRHPPPPPHYDRYDDRRYDDRRYDDRRYDDRRYDDRRDDRRRDDDDYDRYDRRRRDDDDYDRYDRRRRDDDDYDRYDRRRRDDDDYDRYDRRRRD